MVRANVATAAVLALTVGAATAARAELIVGTTFQDFLITWDSANPGQILTGVAIQGLSANEKVVGIDIRPANNQLYAVGSFGRLYTINMTTGQATQVGAGSFTPSLNGAEFGIGFNPTNDTIRLVSDARQNLRINPTTAAVTVDTPLTFATGDEGQNSTPNIVHVAYTNPNGNGTTLFGIDTGRDRLVRITTPNSGVSTTVGALGIDATELGGFDVSPTNGTAYGAFLNVSQSRSTFGTVNLTTGAFTPIGEIGGGNFITTLAVVPTPATLALLGLGLVALRRRR
jgi:uncharacterized protein (TIGR03382 family)